MEMLKTMAVSMVLVFLFMLIFGALRNLKLRVSVSVMTQELRAELRVRWLFKIVPISLTVLLSRPGPGGIAVTYGFWGRRHRVAYMPAPRKRKRKISGPELDDIIRAVSLDVLTVRGAVSIDENAALSAVLAGLVRRLCELSAVCESGGLIPYFDGRKSWLNLDGILTIHTTQIITALLRQIIKSGRKKT